VNTIRGASAAKPPPGLTRGKHVLFAPIEERDACSRIAGRFSAVHDDASQPETSASLHRTTTADRERAGIANQEIRAGARRVAWRGIGAPGLRPASQLSVPWRRATFASSR
jgi:hypothetical protein